MALFKKIDEKMLRRINEFYDTLEGLEQFELWDDGAPGFTEKYGQRSPRLAFLPRIENAKATFIVCPGGGYKYKADYEGRTVAEAFHALGYNTAVLDYRCVPYTRDDALEDAKRAIRFVRANAEMLGIKSDKVVIGGFSAGGHLSTRAATQFDYGNPNSEDVVERFSARPDAAIIAYGNIIDSEKNQHNPTGREKTPADKVKADSTPMFMWMTRTDQLLSPLTLYKMAEALQKNNVPYEAHVFDNGPHGMGLCNGTNPDPIVPVDTHVGYWVTLADEWMQRLFKAE